MSLNVYATDDSMTQVSISSDNCFYLIHPRAHVTISLISCLGDSQAQNRLFLIPGTHTTLKIDIPFTLVQFLYNFFWILEGFLTHMDGKSFCSVVPSCFLVASDGEKAQIYNFTWGWRHLGTLDIMILPFISRDGNPSCHYRKNPAQGHVAAKLHQIVPLSPSAHAVLR